MFILMHISLDLLYPCSAEAYIGWGGKLNGHLMASCIRNICTKNYQNLIIAFQVTVENVGDVFLRHSVFADFFYVHIWMCWYDWKFHNMAYTWTP